MISFSYRFVYRFIPVPVIFKPNRKSEKILGRSLSIIIVIYANNKDYREDIVLHELTHVKQFYRTGGLHFFLYKLSDRYRIRSEIEAYLNQFLYNYNSHIEFIFDLMQEDSEMRFILLNILSDHRNYNFYIDSRTILSYIDKYCKEYIDKMKD